MTQITNTSPYFVCLVLENPLGVQSYYTCWNLVRQWSTLSIYFLQISLASDKSEILFLICSWIKHMHMLEIINPVFDPDGWKSLSKTTIHYSAAAHNTSRGQSAKWTWTLRKFCEASWEARTGEELPNAGWLGKGWRRQPRQEPSAPQYRLQVHQSPSKLKARWGLGFASHI